MEALCKLLFIRCCLLQLCGPFSASVFCAEECFFPILISTWTSCSFLLHPAQLKPKETINYFFFSSLHHAKTLSLSLYLLLLPYYQVQEFLIICTEIILEKFQPSLMLMTSRGLRSNDLCYFCLSMLAIACL